MVPVPIGIKDAITGTMLLGFGAGIQDAKKSFESSHSKYPGHRRLSEFRTLLYHVRFLIALPKDTNETATPSHRRR